MADLKDLEIPTLRNDIKALERLLDDKCKQVASLQASLAKYNTKPCGWCIGTSETIDSLEFELEEKTKEIERLKEQLK